MGATHQWDEQQSSALPFASTGQSQMSDSGGTAVDSFLAKSAAEEMESCVKRLTQVGNLLLISAKAQEALNLMDESIPSGYKNKDLLLLQGKCLKTLERVMEARDCFANILVMDPANLDAMIELAEICHRQGESEHALEHLRGVQRLQPLNGEILRPLAIVLTDQGTRLACEGKKDESRKKYFEAIECFPEYGPAYYNLGVHCGHSEEALEYYKRAVALDRTLVPAWANIGVIQAQHGEFSIALESYKNALRINPTNESILQNAALSLVGLGNIAKAENKSQEAISFFEDALLYDAKCVEALYNLGILYNTRGEAKRAVFLYETARSCNGNIAEIHNNLGALYCELGNKVNFIPLLAPKRFYCQEKAVQCYFDALAVQPTFAIALGNLGVLHTIQGEVKLATQYYEAAIASDPNYIEAVNNYGIVLKDIGLTKESLMAYEKCLVVDPKCRNPAHNYLLGLNYLIPGECPIVSEHHLKWGKLMNTIFCELPPVLPSLSDRNLVKHRTLKVGYISPDLFSHSVSYFAEAPLTYHRSEIVSLVVYSTAICSDTKTELLKKKVYNCGGEWKDVAEISDQDLAHMIRKDGLDILVELSGHTAVNRLGTMAMKPAPIQVTWMGYPNTTGLKQVDYRITDAQCDPEDTEQVFAERLVRVPGCFLCYTPIKSPPDVAPSPCLKNGFVTFGSFNNLAKITSEVIQVWSEILRKVPHSRLIMKNKTFACEANRKRYTELFLNHGVTTYQLDLLPLHQNTEDHLSIYSRMDISLDPWPYAGTTTTCESFLMGVPCLTLAGKCHAQNVGVSLIRAVGLSESWIVHSTAEYVAQAIHKASDFSSLAELRQKLRCCFLNSPLCNGKAHVKNIEDCFQKMWMNWINEQTR